MEHPALYEDSFWFGIAMGAAVLWMWEWIELAPLRIGMLLSALFEICSALESASKKRAQALLDLLEYQKTNKEPLE